MPCYPVVRFDAIKGSVLVLEEVHEKEEVGEGGVVVGGQLAGPGSHEDKDDAE